jgi:hypothetical protein
VGLVVERARRPDERQARLLVLGEHSDLQATGIAYGLHQRRPVGRTPHRRGGHAVNLRRAQRVSDRQLRGHDLCDLGDLGGADRPAAPYAPPDLGIGALLVRLGQPAAVAVRDQQPRRVRPDIYAGAAQGCPRGLYR